MDIWHSERGRQARQTLLRQTAAGDDPELAELAREVLAGRMELREVMYSEAYGEILHDRMQPLLAMWEALSEQERQDAITNADTLLEHAVGGIEDQEEPAPPPRPAPRRPQPTEDETFEFDTYLRRR
jgi:hypothetical protein